MSKEKKRNIIIGSLCAVLLLMAVGYAAFQSALNIEGTSNITSSWNIKITGITSKNIVGTASNNGEPTFEDLTATFKTNLQSPGDSIEYDIVVKNAGTLNAKLDKITLSDTNNPAIKFTSSGLTEGDVLSAGRVTTLTVRVELLSSVTEMPESKTSTLTLSLDYSQSTSEGSGGIATADTLKENIVTSGDGLYEDTYEEGRYVYKGANPSNYITFNNEEWRIIAIEADGTLKIRKNASIGTTMFDSSGYRDTYSNGAGGTYCALGGGGCNAWGVSGNFINGSLSGTVLKDASLNTYLNNDYYNTLSVDAQNQIQSHNYGIGPVTQNNKDLAGQITSEKSTIWNGNIGLMSLSDYLRANTNIEQCGNYLINNSNRVICITTNYLFSADYQRTISPRAAGSSTVFSVVSDGSLSYFNASDSVQTVRPVMFLKSDIKLSGEGTTANPYIIEA